MKTILLLPLLMAAPVLAGTSAKQTIAPAPNPCLTSWFAGASVGYLTEREDMMYNLHAGVTNSCWTVAGWNLSLFAEVGFTEDTVRENVIYTERQYATYNWQEERDIDIVPITANIKFEHALSGNLNAYFGAGLGVAWIGVSGSGTDTPISPPGPATSFSYSDSDWVFTAQVFAGLSYNVAPACEIYGGARWIYFANPNLMGASQNIDDDWLLELGARYKF